MYQHYQYQQPYGQYYSQGNHQSPYQYHRSDQPQIPSSFSTVIMRQCNVISQRASFITNKELTNVLDELFREVENARNEKQRITNLKDIVTVLIRVRRPVLASVGQHKFFTLLQIPLNQLLRQMNQTSHLDESDVIIFRNLVKLLHSLLRDVTESNLYPSWLIEVSLLDSIAGCVLNISKSEKFFDRSNKRGAKHFIRLFDIYNNYQDLLNTDTSADQEKLVSLLDPIVQCLTSNYYLESFDNVDKGATLRSKKEKFFLTRCSTFLTSYNGSRLEPIMTNLLSTMLPKYTSILNKLIPSVNQWKRPMIRAVDQLLQIVNHDSKNPNIISTHLSFIDHVLSIIDVSIFYNNLQPTLSNPETNLIHSAVSLLANFINEPIVLAHIKQKKVTPSLLRLTSTKYEPLVYNIYTILAHTTSEDDIKSMHNPGFLLSTVVKGIKFELEKNSDDQSQIVQLIETLKGLVQHDQLKEEILKQNIHSFLLQCTNRLSPAALTLLLETFWSLSFSSDLATVLRGNSELLGKIQSLSKETKDEGLKKAADGLVWKLVREPAMLDKVAKEEAAEAASVTKQVIIGPDGKEQVIITKKSNNAPVERIFDYDIMISYCHADKDLIKKIHKFLVGEGFKVWIDLDNMFGPAMNAMAEAVENSEFVLLCMSDSYKQSTYCQAEAEYAFGCKRRLVPLIVRPGYKADGWLGFMIGARIYVDFGFFDFETACEKLSTEISRQRQRPLPSKSAQTQQPAKAAAPVAKPSSSEEDSPLFSQKLPGPYTKRKVAMNFDYQPIDRWSDSDVLDFLYSHQLNELMPLCDKMDGSALIQLHHMCSSHHNRTYMILNDQLKETYKLILPIATYTRFLSVMKRLIIPPVHSLLPPPPPQLMLPSPPQQLMLPSPPQQLMLPSPPQQLMVPSASYLQQPAIKPPIRNFNSGYDILITSNAPVLQMLNMVERRGSRWHVKDPTRS